MKQKLVSLFARIALCLVVGYLAYQVITLSKTEYVTEPALLGSVIDEVQVSGVFLRREHAVSLAGGAEGYLSYAKENGERVSAGGLLATVYTSAQQLEAGLEIAELDDAIEQLDTLLARPGIGMGGVSDIDASLTSLLQSLSSYADEGNGHDAASLKSDLVYQMARRQMAVGTFSNVGELRDELAARRSSLSAQLGSARSLSADTAGFFVNYSDGYESVYSSDLAGKLTVAALNELRGAQPVPPADAVGKLVEDYTWYFCCEADKALADRLTAGGTYTLHFSYAPQQDVPVLLESIVVSGEDGYVLTFSSTYITDEILLLRSHTATVVLARYEGLRIRNEARRVIDGQVGVFVRSGLTFEFCPIEVLYADELHSIVRWEQGKSGALKLYDEVVIGGKDLYDGKIIS